MRCAYDDGCRATIGGSAGGKPTRSSSNEQQCACRASSACGSGEGNSPVQCYYMLSKQKLDTTYLFLGPGPISSSGHLPTAKIGRVGGMGFHFSKGRKDLGLVVEHDDV